VALLAGYPAPGVTRQHALRSADFPQGDNSPCDRPTNLKQLNNTTVLRSVKMFLIRKNSKSLSTFRGRTDSLKKNCCIEKFRIGIK